MKNHHKKKNPNDNTIPASKHHGNGHNFNKHARGEDKPTHYISLRRENLRITKLKTLAPHSLKM